MEQAGTRRECSHWAWRSVNNMRRPSNRTTAVGGRTFPTVVNSSTSSPRRRGAAKRATTRRDSMTYTQSLEERGGQPLGQQDNACFRKRKSQLNYRKNSPNTTYPGPCIFLQFPLILIIGLLTCLCTLECRLGLYFLVHSPWPDLYFRNTSPELVFYRHRARNNIQTRPPVPDELLNF